MAAGGQPGFPRASLIFLDNSVEAFEQSPVYLLMSSWKAWADLQLAKLNFKTHLVVHLQFMGNFLNEKFLLISMTGHQKGIKHNRDIEKRIKCTKNILEQKSPKW